MPQIDSTNGGDKQADAMRKCWKRKAATENFKEFNRVRRCEATPWSDDSYYSTIVYGSGLVARHTLVSTSVDESVIHHCS